MRLWTVCITGAALLLIQGACSATAAAEEWMFRRSYYSHAPYPGQQEISPRSRSAYRQPYVGAHPRFAIRGGYRYNSIILQNGSGTDRTIIRENWADVNY